MVPFGKNNFCDASLQLSKEDLDALLTLDFDEVFNGIECEDVAEITFFQGSNTNKPVEKKLENPAPLSHTINRNPPQSRCKSHSKTVGTKESKQPTSPFSTKHLPFYQTITRDHRRDYSRMYINVHNMGDKSVLQKFFREFCTPGCRYVAEFPAASKFNAPKIRRSKNREELIADVMFDTGLFPDLTVHLLHSKIVQRKGFVGSQLVLRVMTKGTVYRRSDPCLESNVIVPGNAIANRRAFYANQTSGVTNKKKLCIHQRKLREFTANVRQQQNLLSSISLDKMDKMINSDDSLSVSTVSSLSSSSCEGNSLDISKQLDLDKNKEEEEQVVVEEEVEECLLCQAVTVSGGNHQEPESSPLILHTPISVTAHPVVTLYLDEFHRIYCYEILA